MSAAEAYLREVQKGAVPSGAALLCSKDELREIELRNQRDVVEYIAGFRRNYPGRDPFVIGVIEELHLLTCRDIYSSAGQFRPLTAGVEVSGADFTPAPASDIRASLTDLLSQLSAQRTRGKLAFRELIAHSANAFHHFLQIHPFLDGNGRVGRAFLHLALYEFGLLQPPEQIFEHFTYHRNLYLRACKEADHGDISPMVSFISFPLGDWRMQRTFDHVLGSKLAPYFQKRLNSQQRKFMQRHHRLRLSEHTYERQSRDVAKRLEQILDRLESELNPSPQAGERSSAS